MAATSSDLVSYLKPRGFVSASAGTTSALVSYLTVRSVLGPFSGTGVVNGFDTTNRKRWKPQSNVPLIDKQGLVTSSWDQYFDFVGEKKLGGARAHTLPQVESLITRSEAESLISNAVAANTAQWMSALAQALAAVREVVVSAALPGAAQIPAIVLQPADPPAPPESPGGE